MVKIRLQKYLSECGVASRRKAEELILEGRVKVNDKIAEIGCKIDPVNDRIRVGKRLVRPQEKGIILFHKPTKVVTTMSDPGGRRSIADYLPKQYSSYFPVGRLDWDSSGLVILTNDGDLAHHLLHPKFELDRVYRVRVSGIISDKTLRRLKRGISLEDGYARADARIVKTQEDSTWLEVTIAQGRNRILRRMFDAVKHPVKKLRRVKHGPFSLGRLKVGEMKGLKKKDYLYFRDRILGAGDAEEPELAANS